MKYYQISLLTSISIYLIVSFIYLDLLWMIEIWGTTFARCMSLYVFIIKMFVDFSIYEHNK